MPLPDNFQHLSGEWKGEKHLYLPWLPGGKVVSASRLTAAKAARGAFMMFDYTWKYEHDSHEGLLLLGFDQKAGEATASWVDSWHMSNRILDCIGGIDADGTYNVLGHYAAPPGPDWGWRITVKAEAEALAIVMFNIEPGAKDELAVEARFRRG